MNGTVQIVAGWNDSHLPCIWNDDTEYMYIYSTNLYEPCLFVHSLAPSFQYKSIFTVGLNPSFPYESRGFISEANIHQFVINVITYFLSNCKKNTYWD